MTKLLTSSKHGTLAFDMYLDLSRKDAAYRHQVAMETWNSLTPLEKRTLQDSARKLAGNNLRFGAEHTQSLLLLKHTSIASAKSIDHTIRYP